MSTQPCEVNQDDAAAFRDALRAGELAPVRAAIHALEQCAQDDPEFGEAEREYARAALLMLCVQCYPTRVPTAIELLLSSQARPDCAVDELERPLSGMRPGLHVSHMTALGQALDYGDAATVQRLFDACNTSAVAGVLYAVVPRTGALRADGDAAAYPVNALGMAIACGQSGLLRGMLDQLDTHDAGVRRAMGEALDAVLATDLLAQAPDSVLGDVVTLIGRGAALSHYAISELATRSIRLDDGSDATRSGPWKYLPFAALAVLAAMPRAGASADDVIGTLKRLQDECEVDLAAVAAPHFPGATLIDFSDLAGDECIGDFLRHSGLRRASTARDRAHVDFDQVMGAPAPAAEGEADPSARSPAVTQAKSAPPAVKAKPSRPPAAPDVSPGDARSSAALFASLKNRQATLKTQPRPAVARAGSRP